ncbi:MAG: hypothetical protein IKF71_05590 [Bacilli bacterium]|nr:hypothetical protein [Bacilli bacterium]
MGNKAIKTKNLKLARVKYFNGETKGAELNDIDAYVFLLNTGNTYINVFDLTDNITVYDRSVYPNVMDDGEEFGTRLVCVSGEVESGPCYVIEPIKGDSLIGSETVSLGDLKEFVYQSELFFVDRIHLLEEERTMKKMKMRHIIKDDQRKMSSLQDYFERHEGSKQYIK